MYALPRRLRLAVLGFAIGALACGDDSAAPSEGVAADSGTEGGQGLDSGPGTDAELDGAPGTDAEFDAPELDAAQELHAEVMADGLGAPFALALFGDRAFFSDGSNATIKSCVAADCTATISTWLSGEQVASDTLKLTSGKLVWATQQHIASCLPDDCANPTILYTGSGDLRVTSLVVSDGDVFFADRNTTTIVHLDMATMAADVLETDVDDVRGMFVSDDTLFFTTYGTATPELKLSGVFSCPRTGCTGSPVALHGTHEGIGAVGVAASSSNVYWAEVTSVNSCPISGCTGAATTLLAGTSSFESLVLLGDALYWSSYISGIHRCVAAQCEDTYTRIETLNTPRSLAHDTTHLWWVGSDFPDDGQLARIPLLP